eukprot:363711-Chlamydomonas_euryale.AAC.9
MRPAFGQRCCERCNHEFTMVGGNRSSVLAGHQACKLQCWMHLRIHPPEHAVCGGDGGGAAADPSF